LTHISGLTTPCIISSFKSFHFLVHPSQSSLRSEFTQLWFPICWLYPPNTIFFIQMSPLLILLDSHEWTNHPMHYKFNQIISFLGSPKWKFTHLSFHSNKSSLNSNFQYVDYTHPKHIVFIQLRTLLIWLDSHQWTTNAMHYKFNQIISFLGSPKSELTQLWSHSNQSSLNSDFQEYVDYTHPMHIFFI